MQTRIGILMGDLNAEQAERLFDAVQIVLSSAFADTGFGTGNVRLETREFVYEDGKSKRVDTREDALVETASVEFQIYADESEFVGDPVEETAL